MKKIFCILGVICCFMVSGCKTNNNKLMKQLQEENPNNLVFYELFIRSSFDSNSDGNGDFKGIEENINYFLDLGIEAIWLMPFHESDSHHGYDVIDYYSVETDYGSLEEFKSMVNIFNENGIRVIMDFVINHTSDKHEWFIKSKNNEENYRDYYVWKGSSAFESFVGGMKDLNLKNEDVIKEIINIGKYYLNLGISGFRLDAAKHFFGVQENGVPASTVSFLNYMFINRLREEFRKVNPNVFVVSEVLDLNIVSSEYFLGSDSVFNFDLKDNIIEKAKGEKSYLYTTELMRSYNLIKEYNEEFIDSPIINNHDLDRLASILGNDVHRNAKLKLASEMLLTLPGSPFIYYGEELGQKGYRVEGQNLPGYGIVYDEYRRLPLKTGDKYQTSWITTDIDKDTISFFEQKNDESSLYNHYKNIIKIRKENMALKFGNTVLKTNFEFNGGNSFIRSFTANGKTQNLLIIHNFSNFNINLEDFNFKKLIYGSNDSNLNSINSFSSVIIEINEKQVEEFTK